MKEILNGGEKRFNRGATTLIKGLALGGGEKSRAVTAMLRCGFANGLGQGSDGVDTPLGTSLHQTGIVIASIQQQRLDGRRQVGQLGLQDMTFASAASDGRAQH